jgi:hypothetical protein
LRQSCVVSALDEHQSIHSESSAVAMIYLRSRQFVSIKVHNHATAAATTTATTTARGQEPGRAFFYCMKQMEVVV